MALSLAAPLLMRCSKRYPNIRLSILEGTSQTIAEAMQKQELDLSVNLPEAAQGPANLLATERLVLASAKTAATGSGEITLREAVTLPLIMPPHVHIIRKLVEWAALQQDVQVNVRYELAGGWILKNLVAEGLGHTVIGQSAITPADLRESLSIRPICSPELQRRLVIVHSSIRASAPAVRAVTALLCDLVAKQAGAKTWNAAPFACEGQAVLSQTF